MNSSMLYAGVAVILYFGGLLAIAWASRNVDKRRGFAIGARQVGVLGTVASINAGLRSGPALVAFIGFGAAMGYGGLTGGIGLAAGMLLFACVAGRIRRAAAQGGYITLADFLKDIYGHGTAMVFGVITMAFLFFNVAAQIHITGRIFSLILPIPDIAGMYFSALMVMAYLFMGGYNTLIRTDILQWSVLLVGVGVLALNIDPALFRTDYAPPKGLDGWDIAGLGLLSFSFLIANQDYWQRCFSTRDGRVARQSFLLSVPVILFLTVPIVMAGMSFAMNGQSEMTTDPVAGLLTASFITPLEAAIFGVFLLSAAMSTMDSQIYSFNAILVKNMGGVDPDIQRRRYVLWVRVATVVSLLLLAFLAHTIEDLIAYILQAAGILTILMPPILFAALAPRRASGLSSIGVAGTMVLGAVAYLIMFFTDSFQGFWSINLPMFGVAAIIVLLFLFSAFPRKDANSEEL